jgi:hypothetical protein
MQPPRRARAAARHLRRARAPGGHRAPHVDSASPRSSCCRSTASSTSTTWSSAGLTNYWGYNSIGYLAPHDGYASVRPSRSCPSSSRWSRPCTRPGIEVILDVVYNHTAEGNHLGPTLSLQGHRQPGLLPARRRRPALLHGLHRHRQQPEHAPPPRAAADHGLAALLGDRDARRRLPLRPRLDAGPRAARRRPAVDLLRGHPAGPGHQPGQAHRRAVGRRRGRLPGRQLPAAVVGVERQVPRHVRDFWRGEDETLPESSPRASPAAPTSTSPTPAGPRVDQLRHRPRRLHPARPRLLQRQAQRGQRRGQPRRHRRQPLVELRRRGPHRRPRGLACAPASSATSSPRCCCQQGVPMLLGGDELGRTQHGNNNAYCQDNEISWFDWDEVDEDLLAFTAALVPTWPIWASATSTPRRTCRPTTGSTHGYDVVDPAASTRSSAARPPGCACARPCARGPRAHDRPGAQPHGDRRRQNPWWWDVLENGPASRYATYFDVDWEASEERWPNKVLLPVLGDHYGRVLEDGQLPGDPRRGRARPALPRADLPAGPLQPGRPAAAGPPRRLRIGAARLPGREPRPPAAAHGDRPPGRRAPPPRPRGARPTCWPACREEPARPRRSTPRSTRLNGDPDALDALIEQQNYRLALVAHGEPRPRLPALLRHQRPGGTAGRGPRGLPATTPCPSRWVERAGAGPAHRPSRRPARPGRVLPAPARGVPRRLDRGREDPRARRALPADWPIAGTTGYDFLNRVGGLFVDPAGEAADAPLRRGTGERSPSPNWCAPASAWC